MNKNWENDPITEKQLAAILNLKLSQSDTAEVGREYQERAIKFAWSADSLTL